MKINTKAHPAIKSKTAAAPNTNTHSYRKVNNLLHEAIAYASNTQQFMERAVRMLHAFEIADRRVLDQANLPPRLAAEVQKEVEQRRTMIAALRVIHEKLQGQRKRRIELIVEMEERLERALKDNRAQVSREKTKEQQQPKDVPRLPKIRLSPHLLNQMGNEMKAAEASRNTKKTEKNG